MEQANVKGTTWSNMELNILKEHYGNIEMNELMELLPGRTENAIWGMAFKLELKTRNSWNSEEIQILKENYGICSIEELLELLPDRKIHQIWQKAHTLGLKYSKTWSKEELEILQQHFNQLPMEELLIMLPKRNESGIRQKAFKLGLTEQKQRFAYHISEIKKKAGIYQIECTATGKLYVGGTKDLHARWCVHLHGLENGQHSNSKLQNDFNEYGLDEFRFKVIEFVEEHEQLTEREQCWMDKLEVIGDGGYNMLPFAGSAKGVHLKESTKEKLREYNVKNIIGMKADGTFVGEWKSLRAASRELDIPHNNISNCCKRKVSHCKEIIFLYASDYYADDFSIESELGNRHIENGQLLNRKRPIMQFDKDGAFVAEYETIREAARVTGFNHKNIQACCSGRSNTSNGFIWRYKG